MSTDHSPNESESHEKSTDHPDSAITTAVKTNERGDVRIPKAVREVLGIDNTPAVLELEVRLKKVLSDEGPDNEE